MSRIPPALARSEATRVTRTPDADTIKPLPPLPNTPEIRAQLADAPAPALNAALGLGFAKVRGGSIVAPGVRLAGVGRLAALTQTQGTEALADRKTFDLMSKREDRPGQKAAREVKFLIVDADTANPKVYFLNTNNVQYHYFFYRDALGHSSTTNEAFNAMTYFSDKRKCIAGTLVAHDKFEDGQGAKGLYTMEFWPTDPVKAKHVGAAFKALAAAMPFAKGKLAYHPAGDTQEALFAQEKAAIDALGVKTVDTTKLFGATSFSSMNTGVGFGMLRVIDPSQAGQRPPTARDVVIFKTLPNDLGHVSGVITEQPQTNLSHVNLKAIQNKTPNAYLKNASSDPDIKKLIGKIVRYEVTGDGYKIVEATEAEATKFMDSIRPKKATIPKRNLKETKIRTLAELRNAQATAYGAKAANLGELETILPGNTPDGFAIPFAFYDRFMKENGFYQEAKKMLADPKFKNDPMVREEKLKEFQKLIKKAKVPAALQKELDAMYAKFPAGTNVRCRSSTNNEDLEGFNGAGLYDSYTHRTNEGTIDKTVKQVWASLWNFRAFEEREFYRIDHLKAAMAVAVHPNQDDEIANGVAVTKNIYDPNWPGFYVNAQVGESLVTNPTPGATPDEMLVAALGEHGEYETQYVRHSTELKNGQKTVLTKQQLTALTQAMEKIQAHFQKVYKKVGDKSFAMDIEFKITKSGALSVKQARPWVE